MNNLRVYRNRLEALTEGSQKFLTAKDRKNLPKLYSMEKEKDPMVWVKFFNPYGAGTWLATEFDGKDTFFGYIMGLGGDELGYFSLGELKRARVEREQYWKPRKLSQAKAYERKNSGLKEESQEVQGAVISEEKNDIPEGFVSKKSRVTIKKIQKPYTGSGVELLIQGKLYDDYLRDYLGSVQPEFFSDSFVKNGWSEEEILELAERVKNIRDGDIIELPRPIKTTVTVLKRKPFSWK